tara:strand:- start:214 stop:561 length:348 start_codon:yes stop_codon:yes gene_type:complete
MDERLDKALEFSAYMDTLNNQKRLLKEKFLENNVYYHNGGRFTIKPELINFCYTLVQIGKTSVVLIDDNDIPVEIENIEEFFEKVADLYYENTNQYVADYTELKNKRSVEGLIDL